MWVPCLKGMTDSLEFIFCTHERGSQDNPHEV